MYSLRATFYFFLMDTATTRIYPYCHPLSHPDALPISISPDLRQRQNVEAVISKGFEFTAQAKLADFFLLGSYAYSHSKVKASGTQAALDGMDRSEEHTSELQSLMRRSYAVFCLKKKI